MFVFAGIKCKQLDFIMYTMVEMFFGKANNDVILLFCLQRSKLLYSLFHERVINNKRVFSDKI